MSYYDAWEATGLCLPEKPDDVQDWHETVELTNDAPEYLLDGSIKEIAMGLGWDAGCDVDGSVVMFDADHQVVDIVWYQQLCSEDGSIEHSGDDTTGEGGGDDEVIKVKLSKLPRNVHHLMFIVCVFSEGVSFSEVNSAYVRMMHGKPKHAGHVLCEYHLSEMEGNAVVLALITRRGAYWNFMALGWQASGRTAVEVVEDPSNLEALQEIDSYDPLLRRIHITVKEGRDLAAKDKKLFGSDTSDPYVKIKYKDEKVKSEVVEKDTSPKWDMEPLYLGEVIESEHKAVKISVKDHDDISDDDFMGALRIPAAALYNAGPGSYEWWIPLAKSKKEKYEDSNVEGEILVEVSVEDVED